MQFEEYRGKYYAELSFWHFQDLYSRSKYGILRKEEENNSRWTNFNFEFGDFSKINLSYFNDQFVFLEKYVYFFISREMNDKSIFSFKSVNIPNRINIL